MFVTDDCIHIPSAAGVFAMFEYISCLIVSKITFIWRTRDEDLIDRTSACEVKNPGRGGGGGTLKESLCRGVPPRPATPDPV